MAGDFLYNVWNATSELRDYVTMKRITLQQLRRDMRLDSLLIEQITYLVDWAVMDRKHSMSLVGATDAWEPCTLHLPVTDGARADVQMVKDSISSVVDVMQAMGSSMYHLLSRVKEMNSLVSNLATVAALERVMLDQCGDLLASATTMQALNACLLAREIKNVHENYFVSLDLTGM
ncbi:AUGMIN subunit 8-like [Aristolochia californica]|uniref:AUGMIN subunit 8-like n=1 Tax=Aristolochia californica TaxID=171875 RepID=UPI0035E3719A